MLPTFVRKVRSAGTGPIRFQPRPGRISKPAPQSFRGTRFGHSGIRKFRAPPETEAAHPKQADLRGVRAADL